MALQKVWNDVSGVSSPSSSRRSRSGGGNAFSGIGEVLNRQADRNFAVRKQDAVEQEYADRRQDIVDERQRVTDDEQSIINRQMADNKFSKDFWANNNARFESNDYKKAIAADPRFAGRSPEEIQAMQGKLVGSLKSGETLRDAGNFARQYREYAGSGDRDNLEIDSGLSRALTNQFPTASSGEIESLLKLMPKGSDSRSSGGGSGKLPSLSTSDVEGIQGYLETNHTPSGFIDSATTWSNPDRGDKASAIAFLAGNGVTDAALIRDTLSASLNPNGSSRVGDINSREGQAALLKQAIGDKRYAQQGSGNKNKGMSTRETLETAMNVINTGKIQSRSTGELLNTLAKYLPKQQAAAEAYVKAGGTGAPPEIPIPKEVKTAAKKVTEEAEPVPDVTVNENGRTEQELMPNLTKMLTQGDPLGDVTGSIGSTLKGLFRSLSGLDVVKRTESENREALKNMLADRKRIDNANIKQEEAAALQAYADRAQQ